MLTLPILTAIVALVVATVALVGARRAVRRATEASEAYWQLRYEHGQLASRVTRVEAQESGHQPEPTAQPAKVSAFVPLSSLKR